NRAGSRLLKNPMPRFDHHVIRF
ncbi:IMP cyclohydrolase, partial [Lacticaseibacillus rhamnosus]